MNPIRVSGPVDCPCFRALVYSYQANELAEGDRGKLQAHLDSCGRCARYLEAEDSFARVLRARIPRVVAPEGLEGRLKGLLDREASLSSRRSRQRRFARVAVLAAASLLIASVVSIRFWNRGGGEAPALGAAMHVVRAAMVVDEDCDRAGFGIEAQRGCRASSHLNSLKLQDGSYWSLSLDQPLARALVVDAVQRGRRFVVEGDLYPTLRTLRLTRLHESRLRRL